MKITISTLETINSHLQGDTSCLPSSYENRAQEYKRRISGCFVPITPSEMISKAATLPVYATKKLDGELAVIFFDGREIVIIGSNGTSRSGLPCTTKAREMLKKAKVTQAIIPAELYVKSSERERGFQVRQALGAGGDPATLCLAPFDIIELDGVNIAAHGYEEVHAALEKLFNGSELCQPVAMKKCASALDLTALFNEWVTAGGAEGIVLRSTLPIIYKVKPKHTIDAAIIGFTEGDGDNRGKVRELLIGLERIDDTFQIIGKTGNGMTEDQKKELFTLFSAIPAASSYIETDSRNVAFRMVQPKYVVEIGFSDLLVESAAGERKQNPLTAWDGNDYRPLQPCNGVSMLHATFERVRDDKPVDAVSTGISQLTRLIGETVESAVASRIQPTSTLLRREVYTKGDGNKLMIQKYLVWKTKQRIC